MRGRLFESREADSCTFWDIRIWGAMDSRSRRTVVPWNPTSGRVSASSFVSISADLSSDVDARAICATLGVN